MESKLEFRKKCAGYVDIYRNGFFRGDILHGKLRRIEYIHGNSITPDELRQIADFCEQQGGEE